MRRYLLLLAATVVAISSCNLFGQPVVVLSLQTSDGTPSASVVSRSVVDPGIEITEFLLSIREVEFKQDELDPDSPADVYFPGPYVLDLLDPTGPLEQTIGNAPVPDGVYEAIRFKLHKTTDVELTSPLYDRSIYIAGTVDDVAFEMWHDTSENLDALEATGVVVGDTNLFVTVDFDLLSLLDQSGAGGFLVDLRSVADDDLDGVIEINPNSEDSAAHADLADDLKDNIKIVADIIDSSI